MLLYEGLPTLLNVVDIHDPLLMPPGEEERPAAQSCILVGYSPSNHHGREHMKKYRYSPKGYRDVVAELMALRNSGGLEYDIIEGKPFDECMRRRKRCHILIDEVITGSYHRCTLEGCSHAQVAINGVAPAVMDMVKRISGGAEPPWVICSDRTLRTTLATLVSDPRQIQEMGWGSRDWMEKCWFPERLLREFWAPALASAGKVR